MEDIDRMELLISELRTLIEDFDLSEHDDESNEDKIYGATAALDALAAHVGDLVP